MQAATSKPRHSMRVCKSGKGFGLATLLLTRRICNAASVHCAGDKV